MLLFFLVIGFYTSAQEDTLLKSEEEDATTSIKNKTTASPPSDFRTLGRKDKNRKEKADALVVLANAKAQSKDLVEALRYYLLAMYELEILEDTYGIASVKVSIGDVFFDAGVFDKALEYYKGAELILLENNMDLSEFGLLDKIGQSYFNYKDYVEALIYFKRLASDL